VHLARIGVEVDQLGEAVVRNGTVSSKIRSFSSSSHSGCAYHAAGSVGPGFVRELACHRKILAHTTEHVESRRGADLSRARVCGNVA
jgi:hypothetical protein